MRVHWEKLITPRLSKTDHVSEFNIDSQHLLVVLDKKLVWNEYAVSLKPKNWILYSIWLDANFNFVQKFFKPQHWLVTSRYEQYCGNNFGCKLFVLKCAQFNGTVFGTGKAELWPQHLIPAFLLVSYHDGT